MDFQHRMLRTVVGSVVDKALRDIPRDPRRSMRNLVDLGESCAKGPRQKLFFAQARKALACASSPYYRIAVDAIRRVGHTRLRTLGLNLGASGLTYGVGVLRREAAARGRRLPWLLAFDTPADPASPLIGEANRIGCYTFLLRHTAPDAACALAGRAPESAFFFEFLPADLTAQAVPAIAATPNLAVSVRLPDHAPEDDAFREACARLGGARCLYGFAAACGADTFSERTSGPLFERMIALGCLFGAYQCAPGDRALEEKLCRLFRGLRGRRKGRPLLLFDLRRDLGYISDGISPDTYALHAVWDLPLDAQLERQAECLTGPIPQG